MKGINLLAVSVIEKEKVVKKQRKIFIFSFILILAFFLLNLALFFLRIRQNSLLTDLDFRMNQKKAVLFNLKEKEIKYRFLKDRLENLTKMQFSERRLFTLFDFLTKLKDQEFFFNNVNYREGNINLTFNDLSVDKLVNLINYLEESQENDVFEKIVIDNLILKNNGNYSLNLSFLLSPKI